MDRVYPFLVIALFIMMCCTGQILIVLRSISFRARNSRSWMFVAVNVFVNINVLARRKFKQFQPYQIRLLFVLCMRESEVSADRMFEATLLRSPAKC